MVLTLSRNQFVEMISKITPSKNYFLKTINQPKIAFFYLWSIIRFLACFFSWNSVFLSQQISRNSVSACFFSEANGAFHARYARIHFLRIKLKTSSLIQAFATNTNNQLWLSEWYYPFILASANLILNIWVPKWF